jgi:hypothetical protein
MKVLKRLKLCSLLLVLFTIGLLVKPVREWCCQWMLDKFYHEEP